MKWIYMHKQILSQLSRQTDIACDRAFRKYKIQYLLGWHYLIIEHFFVFTEIFLFLNVSLQFYWNRVATHQGERLVIKLHHKMNLSTIFRVVWFRSFNRHISMFDEVWRNFINFDWISGNERKKWNVKYFSCLLFFNL